MTLENPWNSSTKTIDINDCNTMALSTKISLPTELKKKRAHNRGLKQVPEDDTPLAILAYQKGLHRDQRISLPDPSLSSFATKSQRKKRHGPLSSSLHKNNQYTVTATTKSSRKNHHSAPTMIIAETSKKDHHRYKCSFPVTEDERTSLKHNYLHHKNENSKKDLYHSHQHRPSQRYTKSSYSYNLNDQNDKSPTSKTATMQIHRPFSRSSKEKYYTISSQACTTATGPESSSPNSTSSPKSKATCFSCLMIRCWSISSVNRMFQRTKKKSIHKIDSMIHK